MWCPQPKLHDRGHAVKVQVQYQHDVHIYLLSKHVANQSFSQAIRGYCIVQRMQDVHTLHASCPPVVCAYDMLYGQLDSCSLLPGMHPGLQCNSAFSQLHANFYYLHAISIFCMPSMVLCGLCMPTCASSCACTALT